MGQMRQILENAKQGYREGITDRLHPDQSIRLKYLPMLAIALAVPAVYFNERRDVESLALIMAMSSIVAREMIDPVIFAGIVIHRMISGPEIQHNQDELRAREVAADAAMMPEDEAEGLQEGAVEHGLVDDDMMPVAVADGMPPLEDDDPELAIDDVEQDLDGDIYYTPQIESDDERTSDEEDLDEELSAPGPR